MITSDDHEDDDDDAMIHLVYIINHEGLRDGRTERTFGDTGVEKLFKEPILDG